MNKPLDAADFAPPPLADEDVVLNGRGRLALYLAVGLGAGSVIALQIDIMRVFAVGNWTHFGSLVVSLAMLGFGLTSAVMAVATKVVLSATGAARRASGSACSDRSRSAPTSISSSSASTRSIWSPTPSRNGSCCRSSSRALTPFLGGAVFLGCVFLKNNKTFGRVYFADLAGSGLCGPPVPRRDVSVQRRST